MSTQGPGAASKEGNGVTACPLVSLELNPTSAAQHEKGDDVFHAAPSGTLSEFHFPVHKFNTG